MGGWNGCEKSSNYEEYIFCVSLKTKKRLNSSTSSAHCLQPGSLVGLIVRLSKRVVRFFRDGIGTLARRITTVGERRQAGGRAR